jgi:ABC-2 type transport system ATP-binding protein
VIEDRVAKGTTVLLTTQYLDEADELADRIAIIDHGTVIAEGTPSQLKARLGAGTLQIRLHDSTQRPAALRVLGGLFGLSVQTAGDPTALSVADADPGQAGVALTELARAGVAVAEFVLGQPSLDEVFLALTGQPTGQAMTNEQEDAA